MSAEWSTNIPPELIPEKAEFRFDPQQWGLSEGDRMSEPNYVYFFIRANECSPLLQSAPDGEDAAEAIYERQAQKRFRHLGVEVLACEMPDWPSDDIIKSAKEHLGQASTEPAPPPAAPVVTDETEDALNNRVGSLIYQVFQIGCSCGRNNVYRYPPEAIALSDQVVAMYQAALRGAHLAHEPEGARDGQ